MSHMYYGLVSHDITCTVRTYGSWLRLTEAPAWLWFDRAVAARPWGLCVHLCLCVFVCVCIKATFSLIHKTSESLWVCCSRDATALTSADGGDTYPFDLPLLGAGINRRGERESQRAQYFFQSDLSSFYTPETPRKRVQYAGNGFAAKT